MPNPSPRQAVAAQVSNTDAHGVAVMRIDASQHRTTGQRRTDIHVMASPTATAMRRARHASGIVTRTGAGLRHAVTAHGGNA